VIPPPGGFTADAVATRTVSPAVEIDLTARSLAVRDGDTVLLRITAAIGEPDHPTPIGR
jgi:hypothetical protein